MRLLKTVTPIKRLCRMTSNYAKLMSLTRNVGIIAHIDAGKTTTTERMLYYAGYMKHVGEVHHGDTVMDYMQQERNRGITITSAAITFPWKGHHINLIDTPGHVDFTIEVERALRVLDGGVVILDGSAGVQAQTLTVWRQANHHKLPRIAFINKMDKPKSNFNSSIESIKSKLRVKPLVVEKPLPNYGRGVIDVIEMKTVTWNAQDEGKSFVEEPIDKNSELYREAMQCRAELVDTLCEHDEKLANRVLELGSYEVLTAEEIKHSVRKVSLSEETNCLVTLCGSAFKNYGVQRLMDAIVEYLPSPGEKKYPFLKFYGDSFCGLAFKTIYHPQKGLLTFVRVYNGAIRKNEHVFNMSKSVSEKVSNLMVAFADEFRPVNEVTMGNIAVISGMKETSTGDTLVQNFSIGQKVRDDWHNAKYDKDISPFLDGVSVPDPVFYCSIEPPSMKDMKQLELALKNLCREDPSLRVTLDQDTGQTVLSGMGELHLEIIRDRIEKEYKVEADLGPLMIAYRETAINPVREQFTYEKRILSKHFKVLLDLEIRPEEKGKPKLKFSQNKHDTKYMEHLSPAQKQILSKGFESSITTGPLLNYPIINSNFILHGGDISSGAPEAVILSAMSEAVMYLMRASGSRLLEPLMKVSITVPDDTVAALVKHDLMIKRGVIGETETTSDGIVINATAPLSELRGYSTHIRRLTSGRALFGLEFSHYEVMNLNEQNKAIEEVTGFAPK